MNTLEWTLEELQHEETLGGVLITVANALADEHDMDVRVDVYKACQAHIRNLILEKAGVDIAEYL